MAGQVVREFKALDQRFEKARTAIVARRLVDLSSKRLLAIEKHLIDEGAEVVDRLEDLCESSERTLAEADWPGFESLRLRAVELATRYEELRELERQVRNARRERFLAEEIQKRLGSRARVVAYDFAMMALIVLVVGLLISHELTTLDHSTVVLFDIIDVLACSVFLGDFFWRMRIAESKKWFWRRYWLDFVTSIPIPTSLLRLGRVVRLARLARMVRIVRLLRIVRTILFFWRGMDKLAATLDVKMMRRSLKILVTVLILGGIGIYYMEGADRVEGVEDMGQSMWWSFTTVVTGGFGDIHNPTTWEGRALTTALIIAGMVVVGIFTATLTSVLVREEDTTAAVLQLEENINEQLAEIREAVQKLG